MDPAPALTVADRPPPAETNPTADKLLAAASGLMIERNSLNVSLSEIAERSGVNSALVKYHFGNKEGLLLALLARDARSEVRNLDYLLAQPISPSAKLKLHIAGIIKAYRRFPYMNRLIHLLLHASSERAAAEVSDVFIKPLFAFQRRLLEMGVAAGEFRAVDPVQFYTCLIGACDHLFFGRDAVSRAAGVGPITDEDCRGYIAFLTDLIFAGLLVAPDGLPGDIGIDTDIPFNTIPARGR